MYAKNMGHYGAKVFFFFAYLFWNFVIQYFFALKKLLCDIKKARQFVGKSMKTKHSSGS